MAWVARTCTTRRYMCAVRCATPTRARGGGGTRVTWTRHHSRQWRTGHRGASGPSRAKPCQTPLGPVDAHGRDVPDHPSASTPESGEAEYGRPISYFCAPSAAGGRDSSAGNRFRGPSSAAFEPGRRDEAGGTPFNPRRSAHRENETFKVRPFRRFLCDCSLRPLYFDWQFGTSAASLGRGACHTHNTHTHHGAEHVV